jgi:hypothetical protein
MLAGMVLHRPRPARKSIQALGNGCRRWRSAGLLVALVTLGVGLGGCGSGSPNSSSIGSISGCSPSGCSSPSASKSLEAMAVKYAACVRAHGVPDFPDPKVGSNGLPNFAGGPNRNATIDSPAGQAAKKACQTELPDLGLQTSAEKAAANAEALKYAGCMRSNGVPNFPDPNGQGVIQIENATGTLNASSPQFQKAETACKGLDNGFGEQSSSAVSSAPGGGG